MDLYMKPEDFTPIFRKIHDHYQMGSDRLFAWKGSTLSPNSMQFGMGWEDHALFNHHHPMDVDMYNVFSVRSLYEALLQYAKNEVPEKFIVQHPKAPGEVKINIGRIAEQNEQKLEAEQPFGVEVYKSNIENLQYRAKMAGFKTELKPYLEHKLKGNGDSFKYVEYQQFNGNTVKYKLHFERDGQKRRYKLPKYEATLLYKMPVEHAVINGVDSRQLEKEMKQMDWYYGIAETTEGMMQGYKDAHKIEQDLKMLCFHKEGALIAAQLWNNHVPLQTAQKPGFIKKAEEESNLYPTLAFSITVPAYLAYKDLQKHQESQAVIKQQEAYEQIGSGTVEITGSWYKEMGLKFYEAFRDATHREFNEGTSLLFKENKPGELLDYFRKQSEAGNAYVVYDPLRPISTKELHCYELFVDAQMHCYEHSKDLHQYFFTSMERMQAELHYSKDINLLEGYVQYLEPKMKYADWTWDYSDDHDVRMKGAAAISKIEQELKKMCEVPGGIEKANELWEKYVPEHTERRPEFLELPYNGDIKMAAAGETIPPADEISGEKAIVSALRTGIWLYPFLEMEPGEIKKHLREMQAEGHHWVAYWERSIPMTKESMSCFKETFDVMEFCHENTTDVDRYSYTSIVHMQDLVTQWERLSYNDVNLLVIEQKMAAADWQYTKAESRAQWEKGNEGMDDIQKYLILLCKLPGGQDKANELWDKYAQGSALSKPYFLQRTPVDSTQLEQSREISSSLEPLNVVKHAPETPDKNAHTTKPDLTANQRKHRHRRDMK